MNSSDVLMTIAWILLIAGIAVFLRSPEFKGFWKDIMNHYKEPVKETKEETEVEQAIDYFSDETKKKVKQELENIHQERLRQSAIAMDKQSQDIIDWTEKTKDNLAKWIAEAYQNKSFRMDNNGVDYCIEVVRYDFFDDHPQGSLNWMNTFITMALYLESIGWRSVVIRRNRDDISKDLSDRIQFTVSTLEGDMEISSSEESNYCTQNERWKRIDGIFTLSNKAN